MSEQSGQVISETGDGFIVGADPPQRPLTQAELAALQANQGMNPVYLQPNGGQTAVAGQRMFTEADVARIREEEKSKLYDRLNGMDEELKSMRKEREDRDRERAAEQERLAAEAKTRDEEAMDVRQLL